ncbi:MAG: hypothetical protein JJU36_06445 [Phycisphaeraceae bacterium]|nr:hypothetical protein [Phycisphaeraceae bacterium]
MLDPIAITIEYQELEGSPIVAFTSDGVTVQRELRCLWSERLTLARQLLGGNVSGGYHWPHAYAPIPSARVHHVDVRPFPPPALRPPLQDHDAEYLDAQISVHYRTSPLVAFEGRLVSETLEALADDQLQDGDSLFWHPTGAGGQGPSIGDALAPSRRLRGFNWAVTHHQVTQLPLATLTLVGHINDSILTSPSLGLVFPQRTLLYQPPSMRRIQTPEDAPAWDVTFRFAFRGADWNLAFDPKREDYFPLYARNSDQPVTFYPEGDFTQLWSQ